MGAVVRCHPTLSANLGENLGKSTAQYKNVGVSLRPAFRETQGGPGRNSGRDCRQFELPHRVCDGPHHFKSPLNRNLAFVRVEHATGSV